MPGITEPAPPASQAEKPSMALLLALNAAATALQGSIESEQAVYAAFRDQITALGLRGGISLLDQTGENLVFQIIAYGSMISKILSRFERLLKLPAVRLTHPWQIHLTREAQ